MSSTVRKIRRDRFTGLKNGPEYVYIKDWKDLENYVNDHPDNFYTIDFDRFSHETLDDAPSSGTIRPKRENQLTLNDYNDHHKYLSTHTFYGSEYESSTLLLQKFGFKVILANWDE